jgi:ABC-type lipoprotein export system ATPase subunit
MVTHNLALAQRCDSIIELIDGRIVSNPDDSEQMIQSARAAIVEQM